MPGEYPNAICIFCAHRTSHEAYVWPVVGTRASPLCGGGSPEIAARWSAIHCPPAGLHAQDDSARSARVNHYGRTRYPTATTFLVLADGGGSHSARHLVFKAELQRLGDTLKVTIRMAHDPYCSKWNPVEHRVSPHFTRTMQGAILTSQQQTKILLERAGVILADQVKNLDWQARDAEFICTLPDMVMREVLQKIGLLLTE